MRLVGSSTEPRRVPSGYSVEKTIGVSQIKILRTVIWAFGLFLSISTVVSSKLS